jgi:drug/metabolite transporter (DMT)-like permease
MTTRMIGGRATAAPGWLALAGLLLATGALLGLSTNLAKLAVDAGLSPLAFLAWSTLGAAALVGVVAAAEGALARLDRRTGVYFAVSALVSVAAPNLLFFCAVPHVGAGFVALSIAFPPLLTYLGALALRMERFDAVRAAGVGLALAGAATLAWAKLRAPDAPAIWIAATLAGPVLLALGNLYRTLRWPAGARPDSLAPGMLGAAALMLLGAGLLPGTSLRVDLADARQVGLVLLQALVVGGMYLLYFRLQGRGGPVLVSLLGSVAALVGVPAAVLLLGEATPPALAPAATLIAAGTALVTWRAMRRAGP